MNRRCTRLLALLLPLAIAAAASGVIIDTGDGTGNVTAPAPDPGWGHVGIANANGLSAVYLGNGWVLTANHVNAGDVWFGGVLYPWMPGTAVQLTNPDTSGADLLMFKIADPLPALPGLSIRATPPPLGTSLILIGYGRDRGAATTWNPPGPGPTYDGWYWAGTASKRWGTNFVEDIDVELYEPVFSTQLFGCEFDQSGGGHSTHEAQGAVGDSGGAAFAWNGSSYELAGIMIGILSYSEQPANTALFTNATVTADLSVYRDEIVDWMPEPTGGLWVGAGLVAALARRRVSAPSSAGSRRTSDRAR
jgi:hypothetical protein